ncbi:hypothetical protein SmJEL517_g00276 [Synchytrium microbalum]|uniref:Potassium channel tetramerisation-type BTB domain-containing protein n=1 Tax=Synchytrium microbalum TaxID=1806994 RepID=A0A507C8P4_9FUNG|nr:uncharacterized protein SmJEL517_g00276 [Synchytrium microbalum]TPX37960.1 hypothetical protein SmJEL517_g00276 [Synchytrium microbalum]
MNSNSSSNSKLSMTSPLRRNNSGETRLTTTFNVSGQMFEVSNALLNKFPNCKLSIMANSTRSIAITAPSSKSDLFVDLNPYAFNVVLDYMRYGKLYCPRNVAKEVVDLQLRALDIEIKAEVVEIDADDLYPTTSSTNFNINASIEDPNQPPPYTPSISNTYNRSDTKQPISTSSSSSVQAQVQLSSTSKLENLIGGWLSPIVITRAKRGLRKLKFLFVPMGVELTKIAGFESLSNDGAPIEIVHMNRSHTEDSESVGDIVFLTSSGTPEELARLLVLRTGIVRAVPELPEIFTRTENQFGTTESQRHPALLLHVTLA